MALPDQFRSERQADVTAADNQALICDLRYAIYDNRGSKNQFAKSGYRKS